MPTTYHIKASEVDRNFIENIKKQFSVDDPILIITVAPPGKIDLPDKLGDFEKLEKRYPAKRVKTDRDFNAISDEINR